MKQELRGREHRKINTVDWKIYFVNYIRMAHDLFFCNDNFMIKI